MQNAKNSAGVHTSNLIENKNVLVCYTLKLSVVSFCNDFLNNYISNLQDSFIEHAIFA